MKEEIDKEEMKKCLKDANIYEENMSEDLMAEYYEAIKNSETSLIEETQKDIEVASEAEKSANELLEVINHSESIAPSKRGSYVPKSDDDESLDAFSQDILNSKETNNNNNNNNNSILTDNKQEKAQANDVLAIKNAPIGFNDMPKSPKVDKDMLKIISHKLRFINIQNSKKFLIANSESRIIMLYNYHKAVSKLRAHYASLSTNMATIGKSITTIDHDLCVNPVISTLKEEEIQLTETTYISRSGRHTKRKVYIDDDFLDLPNGPTKRSKSDDDWKNTAKCSKLASKKNESEDAASSNNSSPARAKIKRNESPDSSQHDALDPLDNTEPPPKPRTYQRKRLTNEEIIATNPLFKDITTTKRSRAGALVSAGKEEAERKRQQEKEMARFTSSLDTDSQDFDDESEKIIVDDDDEDVDVVEKKRIIPPLPTARRNIHGRRRGGATAPEALNISAKRPNLNTTSEISNSPAVNGISRKPPQLRRAASNHSNSIDKGEPSSSSGSSRGKKDLNMTPCPLCSMSFPQKEIEEHAATCGEDVFPQTAAPKRITCEICDTIVPFTTQYEVHVKACLAKKNSGG